MTNDLRTPTRRRGFLHRFRRWIRRPIHDTAGFSLVEELVALGLVAVGLVLLVAIITTGSIGVTTVTQKTTAGSLARSQLELVKSAAYEPDPSANPYPSLSVPAGYTVSLTIDYWDEANQTFTSSVTNDGLQRINVTVSSDGDDLVTLQDFKVDR